MVAFKRVVLGIAAGTAVVGTALAARNKLGHRLDVSGSTLDQPKDEGKWEHFKEYLGATGDSVAGASHQAAALLRALREAWRRRAAELEALERAAGGEGGGAHASLATFLALVAEGGDAQEARLLSLASTRLLDWLLAAAAERPGSVEEAAVQRWLLALLADDATAAALLERPGVPAHLLRLAVQQPALAAALSATRARPSALPLVAPAEREDVAAAVQVVAGHAPGLRALQPAARREVQRAALQLLAAWAAGSVVNCTRVADAGAGPALAELAAASTAGGPAEGLQLEIATLMQLLAADCPRKRVLQMPAWLYHLLCFAADAAAGEHWRLADAALRGFAACLLKGCELPAQLMCGAALPLLERLAAQPASPVRPAIAATVRALAEGGGVDLPADERTGWAETLLSWLVEPPPPGCGSQGVGASCTPLGDYQETMQGVVAALAALAAPAGAPGLHIAHSWLAELITHLSRQVQPYGAVSPPKPAAPAPAPSGRQWYQLWGGGEAAEAPPGAAPLPQQQEPGAAQVPLITEEAEQALASAAGGEASAAGALPPPPPPRAGVEAGGGGWWRLWPFGGGGGGAGGGGTAVPPAAVVAARPSDPELSAFINAAQVGPVYARSVAADLLNASGRVGAFQEPPPSAEELMSPAEIAAYPKVAAAIDMEVADKALCQALKVLCALASGGEPRHQWLLSAGILPLLRRLALEHGKDVTELTKPSYFEDAMPLCIKQQTVRLLAMLAGDLEGAAAVQRAGWVPWLQDVAQSTDCKLSSCAARALLHVESALAARRRRRPKSGLALLPLPAAPPELLPERAAEGAGGGGDGGSGGGSGSGEAGREGGGGGPSSPQELLQEAKQQAQQALRSAKRKLERQLDAVRDPVPPAERLVLQDGVHLFDPLAPHHSVLAREGVSAHSADSPLMDVVFVHGIRGGAFATWRREGALENGQAPEALERSVVWPSAWVAADLPQARLISAEYAAPASGWEGESLSFKHTVAQLMDKLVAAGVGARPVVFVCHSMGGLVVKELLANAAREQEPRLQRLASAAAGAVFYSVPHFGSRLADWGWQLRFIGASPARAVENLKMGPHLEELNAEVRAMCKAGRLPVLSFGEGQPMRLAYVRTHVVPHESAFPGYGEFVVLREHDHINVCKPTDRDDPSYARLIAFLRRRVHDVALVRAEEELAEMDHMEPVL